MKVKNFCVVALKLEKSFNCGIFIPTKKRLFNKTNDERMSNKCYTQINENKEYETILYLIKRQAPVDFDHILPSFKV